MPNFIPYDYNQSTMVVINFEDQLQPGTFEHAINYLVENKLDLSVYFSAYNFIINKNKKNQTFTDWMKERIDSSEGRLIYSHRMSVVEPVFGNIGTNKGLNRFSLRGKQPRYVLKKP